MKKETLEALKGSIRKWEGIVAGTATDRGALNCPLCALFWRWECKDCPVASVTGEIWCRGTPYRAWEERMRREAGKREWTAFDEESRRLAEGELRFLKGLLPKRKTHKRGLR